MLYTGPVWIKNEIYEITPVVTPGIPSGNYAFDFQYATFDRMTGFTAFLVREYLL